MTSTQRMLVVLGLVFLAVTAGCAHEREFIPPTVIRSPYDTSRGDVLFAVIPLRNETGTTVFSPEDVSDAVVRALSSVEGIRCLPVNRTIAEMRGLGMRDVVSPEDVSALAGAMNVDGIVVGSVTAYDPYDPPTLGLTLALHTSTIGVPGPSLDVSDLRGSVTELTAPTSSRYVESPNSSVSEVYSGRNHAVQMAVRRYAEGRSDHNSARGWRTYLASMSLYTDFVAYAAVRELLDHERLRLARSKAPRSTR